MATSTEKVHALGARLPELVQDLGLGGLAAGAVAMLMPMLEGELRKVTAMPPEELDAMLEKVAEFVLELVSDTAPAIEASHG